MTLERVYYQVEKYEAPFFDEEEGYWSPDFVEGGRTMLDENEARALVSQHRSRGRRVRLVRVRVLREVIDETPEPR